MNWQGRIGHNSGTTHIVPLLTHPNDIARMGIVRIFNRKDHYVRVQLITQRFGNGAWCDIPPYAVLTKDGTEIYDLLYNKYGPPGEGQNMDLEVRAQQVEPDYEPSGLFCQEISDGWHDYDGYGTGGRSDFVGVMAFHIDADGNLVNLLSTPSRNLSVPWAVQPHRSVFGDFNITLHFVGDGFNKSWREAVMYAAARWEQVIIADYPETTIDTICGESIESREIDDILISVQFISDEDVLGTGAPCRYDSDSGRPVTGQVNLSAENMPSDVEPDFFQTVDKVLVHEMGHALGFGIGSSWGELVEESGEQLSFLGPKAIEQFTLHFPDKASAAKEAGYTGVPLDNRAHWGVTGEDYSITEYDVMSSGVLVTPVTIGAFDDLGYTVDYTAADLIP